MYIHPHLLNSPKQKKMQQLNPPGIRKTKVEQPSFPQSTHIPSHIHRFPTETFYFFSSGLAPLSNSHDSPISQTPKPPLPCSIPFHAHASLSSFGGAMTSSSVKTQVPQCMPSALTQRVSTKMLTASLGFAWTLLKAQRGSYAPMGMRPRSKGPLCLPICAKAGHVGRCEYAAE